MAEEFQNGCFAYITVGDLSRMLGTVCNGRHLGSIEADRIMAKIIWSREACEMLHVYSPDKGELQTERAMKDQKQEEVIEISDDEEENDEEEMEEEQRTGRIQEGEVVIVEDSDSEGDSGAETEEYDWEWIELL